MNLPRNKLELQIKEFLDQYHKVNYKIPNQKSIQAKIKKLVDILFIYDGKQLNISNNDIINELQRYNEIIDPLHAGETAPATLQKYKKIGVKLIDNKEYLKVANGKMSVFDVLDLYKDS